MSLEKLQALQENFHIKPQPLVSDRVVMNGRMITFGALPTSWGFALHRIGMAFAMALLVVGILTICRMGALNAISSKKWVTAVLGAAEVAAAILLLVITYAKERKNPLVEFIKENWLQHNGKIHITPQPALLNKTEAEVTTARLRTSPSLQAMVETVKRDEETAVALRAPASLQRMAESIAKVVEEMPPCSMLKITEYSVPGAGLDGSNLIRLQDGSWTLQPLHDEEATYLLGEWIPSQLIGEEVIPYASDWYCKKDYRRPSDSMGRMVFGFQFGNLIAQQTEESYTVKPDCPLNPGATDCWQKRSQMHPKAHNNRFHHHD